MDRIMLIMQREWKKPKRWTNMKTYREVRIEKNAQVNSLNRQDVALLRMNDKGSSEEGCGEGIINSGLIMLSLSWTSVDTSRWNFSLDKK